MSDQRLTPAQEFALLDNDRCVHDVRLLLADASHGAFDHARDETQRRVITILSRWHGDDPGLRQQCREAANRLAAIAGDAKPVKRYTKSYG